MTHTSHRSSVLFVFYKLDKSVLELEVQELFVKVTIRSCLCHTNQQSARWEIGHHTRTIPNVPSALWHSATMRLGVDGFPQTMASLKISMDIGSKSLGSRYGICRLIQFMAAWMMGGVLMLANADGGYRPDWIVRA